MKILSIETSCDDTGIAILEVSKTGSFHTLSNIIASQIEIHKQYGGVYPMMAKREHQKNILPVLTRALKQASLLITDSNKKSIDVKKIAEILEREPDLFKKIIPFFKKYKKPDVDFIAVTNGPGLEPCLWVGVNFAKCLSYFWNIPIIPVNHIEAHILVNLLENPATAGSRPGGIKFPAISLVVSGGHTQIILVERIGKYKVLGETRDDAAGECFDKCAKILGLDYPGGPVISKLAAAQIESGRASPLRGGKVYNLLPRPMIGTKDYDFSFSGLKTAVLYKWQKINKKDLPASATLKALQAGMSAEVQQAIIDVLLKKTIKAIKDFNAKTLILGGGVTANKELRKQFEEKIRKENLDLNFLVPSPSLSTDNGLMIAVAGFYHKKETKKWETIKADGNLRI